MAFFDIIVNFTIQKLKSKHIKNLNLSQFYLVGVFLGYERKYFAPIPGHSENDQVRQRRDFMKKVGKESRHNVISRKDNLILHPDQPPTRIEEAIEVSYLKNYLF